MTWTNHHSRGAILREVCDVADLRRDGLLPMDVPGVTEKFDSELDLLGALQLRWHTRLAGYIERVLAEQPLDLESAVVRAWHEAAAELPGVRALLDHHRACPADETMAAVMTKAVAKEHIMLAVMAGQGAYADDLAARVGERIEERARQGVGADLELPAPRHSSLLDRIREVLAA